MTVSEYLEAIKERLLTDPLVSAFDVVRERATLTDGHLRARLTLSDGSQPLLAPFACSQSEPLLSDSCQPASRMLYLSS